jgi:hypothetical protein
MTSGQVYDAQGSANMLFSIVENWEAFLYPVSGTSACFQKTKRWKTKPKIEIERSQNEKSILTLRRKKEFKELQEFKNGSQEAIGSGACHWRGAA